MASYAATSRRALQPRLPRHPPRKNFDTESTEKNGATEEPVSTTDPPCPPSPPLFSVSKLFRGLSPATPPGIRPERCESPCETAPTPSIL
jgi:hypothetical protein